MTEIKIEDLLGKGRVPILNIESKKPRLQNIIDNVIKPLEDEGYNFTVICGLLGNSEVSDITDVFLRRDYIYGYGVDLTTGIYERDIECVEFIQNIPHAQVTMCDTYFHVSYDLENNIQNEIGEEIIERRR